MKSTFLCRCALVFVILTQSILILYLQSAGSLISSKSTKLKELFSDENDPIDVVFTWVNGSDPRFLDQLHKFSQERAIKNDVNGNRRFAEKSELKYSPRSIEKNMPWIRHVFIVTNGQVPSWLNLDNGLATVVPHEAIFLNISTLPTFSSEAIEVNLHRIPGLSRRFLYFNDDFMIGRPVDFSTFFTPADGIRLYWGQDVPPCAKLCPWSKVNNGHCDFHCNVPQCQMDGNDCNNSSSSPVKSNQLRQAQLVYTVYSLSIQHTNRVFNNRFGFKKRKFMPHMPILVDRDVMADAWKEFHTDLRNTSSHRFRNIYDLQFQMFYAFYMHSKQIDRSLLEVLTEEDVNLDGFIDTLEMRTLSLKHYQGTQSIKQSEEFNRTIVKCITNSNKTSKKVQQMVKIDINMLAKCKWLKVFLENTLMQQPKYKHVMMPLIPGDFFYTYRGLDSNLGNVIRTLNDLRMKPRKFICLNDVLTYNKGKQKVNVKIYNELAMYYESMFPFQSRYELPPGKVNNFGYIQDRNVSAVSGVDFEKKLEQI